MYIGQWQSKNKKKKSEFDRRICVKSVLKFICDREINVKLSAEYELWIIQSAGAGNTFFFFNLWLNRLCI